MSLGGRVSLELYLWRKGWDSNPRYHCWHDGFQDRYLRPLGHPSIKTKCWRRGRDSNPRRSFRPSNDLANRPLQPLGYLSLSAPPNYINLSLLLKANAPFRILPE